ncbi:MAG: magnesium transporter, partial [Deltaproteobacteria bacterium]|nr:magnesium transporter [Deltaproteobacteria bacterium]
PERLVEAVDTRETDDAADVIADLPDETRDEVLPELSARDTITALMAFPEDSAGGIMQTELCRVREDATAADVIEAVRHTREEVEEVLEVYVVDTQGRLRGTVALDDLVVTKPDVAISTIAEPVEHRVTPQIDQEEVAKLFVKYDLYTLPVVDESGVLLGRITYDDVHDVLQEEASEDLMTSVGASTEDLVYSSQPFRIALFRLPWLGASLLGSLLTGFLLSQFGHLPGDALVMASFVPVVMAMTGNVGSQSSMIVTRGFALGKVDFGTLGRTFLRELSVGLIMGLLAGTTVGLIGYAWRARMELGVAVFAAMGASMTVAATMGVAAPAAFKRLGIDPAIAAGPLVTTGCDVMGVGIYLLVALAVLT